MRILFELALLAIIGIAGYGTYKLLFPNKKDNNNDK